MAVSLIANGGGSMRMTPVRSPETARRSENGGKRLECFRRVFVLQTGMHARAVRVHAEPDILGFTFIVDDLVFPDGTTTMGSIGGGGPQTLVSNCLSECSG